MTALPHRLSKDESFLLSLVQYTNPDNQPTTNIDLRNFFLYGTCIYRTLRFSSNGFVSNFVVYKDRALHIGLGTHFQLELETLTHYVKFKSFPKHISLVRFTKAVFSVFMHNSFLISFSPLFLFLLFFQIDYDSSAVC